MNSLHFTLLSDGSSDRALLPLLTWLLIENHVERPIQRQWADLSRIRIRPRTLSERINVCLQLYPCDLLFVHRDAENVEISRRSMEITRAVRDLNAAQVEIPALVEVIPVRMLEAWLLFSEPAIRAAAANSNGNMPIDLPPLRRLEQIPDPKHELHTLLRSASGLRGRRLNSFPVYERAIQVADHISDFSPLRVLPAFQRMEVLLQHALSTLS